MQVLSLEQGVQKYGKFVSKSTGQIKKTKKNDKIWESFVDLIGSKV